MKSTRAFLGLMVLLSLVLVVGALAQQPAGQTQPAPAASQRSTNPPGAPRKQAAPNTASLRGMLLSTETLLGTDVKNAQGEELGEIRQLMIDPANGRVLYAVVAMGGFLGLGEKSILVPWRAMEVARDGNSIVLNVSRQVLQEMSNYEPGQDAELAERRWREGMAADKASRGAHGSNGWGADTPYGRLYDPAKEQTVSGQVASVEVGAPLPGMAPGTQMLVRTEDGKSMRAHLGPEWYLAHQEGGLQENTRVQVSGALVELEGQPVLMAREVHFDGQVLMLRDVQGMPMWSSLRRSAQ